MRDGPFLPLDIVACSRDTWTDSPPGVGDDARTKPKP